MFARTVGVLLMVQCFASTSREVPEVLHIGVLVEEGTAQSQVVDTALDYVNKKSHLLPNTTLRAETHVFSQDESGLATIQAVCSLLGRSVVAVIGPGTSSSVRRTHPLCAGLHVPHLSYDATDTRLSFTEGEFKYLVKMSSPDKYQTEALTDIAAFFGWTKFVIIADNSDYGRNGVSEFMERATLLRWKVESLFYLQLDRDIPTQVRPLLNQILNTGVRIVLLFTLSSRSRQVLDEAAALGLMSRGWAWLVTDGTTSSISHFTDEETDGQLCNETVKRFRGLIGPRPPKARGKLHDEFLSLYRASPAPGPYTLKMFDAVLAVAHGLHNLLTNETAAVTKPVFENVCCNESVGAWEHGEYLLEHIAQINIEGITNHLNFTPDLYPGVNEYEIVNLQASGWTSIGNWTELADPKLSLDTDRLMFPGESNSVPSDLDLSDLTKLNLSVVTILERPFVLNTTATGQAIPLSGFCVDLLRTLSDELGFSYSLYVVEDGKYGAFVQSAKRWNGIIQDIVTTKADMAVAPLTITAERQKVVDFSKPYMDLGLTILMPRDVDTREVLSFLDPFHPLLWLSLLGSYFAVSIVASFCSFFSPFGYGGRYIQRPVKMDERYSDDRDNYSFFNSLWHTFGVWMQQGCDMTPRCLSARVVFGTWMFASMVITATYTANLAAFLTVSRLDTGINSIEDLANQDEVEYGTVVHSAPYQVFKDSVTKPYRKMYLGMENNIDKKYNAFVSLAEEGVQLAKSSYGTSKRYAFIFDSAPLEYAARRKPCTTTTVDLFKKFGYGLAFPKNSPLTAIFTHEILKLREGSYFDEAHTKWFQAECDLEKETEVVTNQQANLWSMRGVFYVIVASLALSALCVLAEWLVAASRDARSSRRAVKAAAEARPASVRASLDRRQRAVRSYLRRIWCTCDCDSDSASEEDNETASSTTLPPPPAQQPQNSTRMELYSQCSDYNEDHSRAGAFRASSRRKRKSHRDKRPPSSEFHEPEEARARPESPVVGPHRLSDNVSQLSVPSGNDSFRGDVNSYGQTPK